MKKILLSLGAISSIAAPIAAVVSCGSETTEVKSTTTVGASTENHAWPSGNIQIDGKVKDSLKSLLNTGYNTVNAEDIGDVALYTNGIETDDIEGDFAIGFSLNKNVHVELGAWGYDFAKDGEIFITANKTGQIKFYAKTYSEAEYSSHFVTGSQKAFFKDLAKSRGFIFTEHEETTTTTTTSTEQPAPAAPTTATPTEQPVVQEFDFAADIAKISNKVLQSTKGMAPLTMLIIGGPGFVSQEQVGLEAIHFSQGTTVTFINERIDGVKMQFIYTAVITHGSKTTKIQHVVVQAAPIQVHGGGAPAAQPGHMAPPLPPHRDPAPAPEIVSPPDPTPETVVNADGENIDKMERFLSVENTVNKTVAQLEEMMNGGISADLIENNLGLKLPGLTGVRSIVMNILAKVDGRDDAFYAEITFPLSDGSDFSTEATIVASANAPQPETSQAPPMPEGAQRPPVGH